MLKSYFKLSIIVLVQFIALAILLIVVSSLLFNNTALFHQWQHFFARFQWAFFFFHALFYLALYMLWPQLVSLITQRQSEKPHPTQIKKALNMRLYLIGVFMVFELLTLLR